MDADAYIMNRRRFLVASGLAATAAVTGIALRRVTMPTPGAEVIMAELQALRTRTITTLSGWSAYTVLSHLAQSIELSMTGYPSLKSPVFRHTAGPTAFFAFTTAGAMRHPLTEPIPGAPAIAENGDTQAALERLLVALDTFAAHEGELVPHFAYGQLSKDEYAQAHTMHIRDHLRLFAPV